MNDELRALITRLRTALNRLEDGPVIGNLPGGNPHAVCEVEPWRQFLIECNGGRFGIIDLWSAEALPAYQDTVLLVENPQDYLIVGQILYEPLAMDRNTEILHWLPRDGAPVELGTTGPFLTHSVFGRGYSELVPSHREEPWWEFLSAQQLV